MKLPSLITKGSNLTEWSRILENYLRSITPKSSGSVRVSIGGGGATFSVEESQATQLTPADSRNPFQILQSAGTDGSPMLGVFFLSNIFKNLAGDHLPITGLLSDETDPDDPGWFACPAIGEKIWLQIGTANPASPEDDPQPWADTTTIQHGKAGAGLWDEYPDPIAVNTDDPAKPFQEFYNLLLAEVTDPEIDPRPALLTVTDGSGDSAETSQITQCWSRNITLVHWGVNGLLCLVPADPAPDFPAS